VEGAETFDYHAWDSRKTRACVCDPTYTDIDCSKRMCGFGTDPLDTRDNLLLPLKYQTQQLVAFHLKNERMRSQFSILTDIPKLHHELPE
jgi:hypothetical protein